MKVRIGRNPEFASITGLTNRNFEPEGIVNGRLLAEQQLLDVYNRIVEDELKADACCRDIAFWETRVQVVRLNTNAVTTGKVDNRNMPRTTAGGVIISSWDENVRFGALRKGLPYVVTFPLKWDANVYAPRHTSVNRTYFLGNSATATCGIISATDSNYENFVAYMYAEDDAIQPTMCDVTYANRSGFMMSGNADMTTTKRFGVKRCNYSSVSGFPDVQWHGFVHEVADDGTVTLTDTRRVTSFGVIRYYTQWTLNECADGTLLSDTLGVAQEALMQGQ